MSLFSEDRKRRAANSAVQAQEPNKAIGFPRPRYFLNLGLLALHFFNVIFNFQCNRFGEGTGYFSIVFPPFLIASPEEDRDSGW